MNWKFKNTLQKIILLIIIGTLTLFVACGRQADYFVEFAFSKTLYDGGKSLSESEYNRAYADVGELLNEIERQISVTQPNSDISRINAAAADAPVSVGEHTYALLCLCKKVSDGTDGAFSPALYNISELWGFTPDFEGKYGLSRPEPSSEEILKTLNDCDFNDIIVRDDRTVIKKNPNVRLDLGGIAKGYMNDCAYHYLKERYDGIQGTLNVMSGSVLMGEKQQDGKNMGYTAALENPRKEVTESIGEGLYFTRLADTAMSTGADNYRFYTYENKIYKHIMNSETGRPAENGAISITVFVPLNVEYACALSDAYSTAGFCMPLTKALSLYECLYWEIGLSAVIVCSDFQYYVIGDVRVMQPKEYAQVTKPSLVDRVENIFTYAEKSSAKDKVAMHEKEKEYIQIVSSRNAE